VAPGAGAGPVPSPPPRGREEVQIAVVVGVAVVAATVSLALLELLFDVWPDADGRGTAVRVMATGAETVMSWETERERKVENEVETTAEELWASTAAGARRASKVVQRSEEIRIPSFCSSVWRGRLV